MKTAEQQYRMTGSDIIGRCGLYCGACAIYLGARGDVDARTYVLEEWRVPEEAIECSGCHAQTPESAGSKCELAPCMDGNGYEYCSECAEYVEGSCGKFEKSEEMCRSIGIDLRENLKRLRDVGGEAWLAEQEERWSCPDCISPFFWQAQRCPSCKRPLN